MISRSKNPAYRRWLSPLVALVVILAMSPAALAATVPASPTGLAATPGNGQVSLTWAAPGDDGGSAITDYRIQYKKSTALTWTTFPDGASTTLSATVTSLANGTSYDFRVRARNAIGFSNPSNVVSATPTAANPGAPGIPANLAASPGDQQVVLTWDAPADNGSPITDYGVQQRTIGGTWHTFPDGTSTATTATVTLLVNLTTYELRVRARNAVGWGIWSSPITATPAAAAVVPGAPQNLAGVRGDQKVALTWAAPASDGGSPITDYRVYYKKSTASTWTTFPDGVSTNLFATVTLLLNGTSYDFRVRAINAVGMGAPSATVTFTPAPPTVPGVPQNLAAAAGDEQVALTWDPPASDGESPILDYAMRYRTGGGDWTVVNPAASGVIVSGLANGTEYEFQARARNAVGYGAWTASVFATPMTVPSIPLNLAATAPNVGQQVALTWDPPADDGGAAIIDYALHYRTGGGAWTLVDPAASGVIVSGLANGTEYEFQVRARNIVGPSAWTASVFATPATFPGIPQNLAAAAGNQQATLTWDPPADDGGAAIIDYAISYRVSGGSWSAPATAASGVVVSGLDNGTSYDFRVRARNSVGVGTWSAPVSATPRTVPDAPTGLAATPGNTQVALTWAAPAFNGGAAITDYVVQYRSGGGWLTFPDGTSTNLFATVTGLTNGTNYEFQVLAHNIAGDGAPSTSVFSIPRTVPGMPTGLLITFQGDQEVGLSWAAPASNGGAAIFDYEVEYCEGTLAFCTGGGTWVTFPDATSTATTTTVTGLTNGTLYQFQVRAENVAGLGEASASVAGKPRTVPDAPTGLAATPGNTQVALTWAAPAFDGGMPVTDYVVQYRSGGGWSTFPDGTSTNLFATVTGLTNGTNYEFRVLAHNIAGDGAPSTSVFSIPRTVPGAPTGLAATPGNTQVALTWAAPASNGGAAITDYVVQYRSGGGGWSTFTDGTSTNLFATVTGLTNGTNYEFRVLAHNIAGDGAPSAGVFATPATNPGIPQNLAAARANQQVTLTWGPPADDGGSAILDYAYEYRISGGSWSSPIGPAASGVVVGGLTNGTTYEFRVRARNTIGSGTWSDPVAATPATTPGAPQGLAAASGNTQVVLTFTAPASDGGSAITDYQVQYKQSSSGTWLAYNDGAPSAATGRTVTGLTNGTSYDFQVQAVNAIGSGPWTGTVSATPAGGATVPSVPRSLTPTAGNGQVTLAWLVPTSDGGSAITDYVVQYRYCATLGGGGSCTTWGDWATFADTVTPTTGATVTGLWNGDLYGFRVAAVNGIGQGDWTAVQQSTPVCSGTCPLAPTGLTNTGRGPTYIDLDWSGSSSNCPGGCDDYEVRYRVSGTTTWTVFPGTSASDQLVTGLTASTTYNFQVRAREGSNWGNWSATYTVATTAPTAPGTPGNFRVTGYDSSSVSLAWDAPSDDGGESIDDYQVQYRRCNSGSGSCSSSGWGGWSTYNDGTSTDLFMTVGGLDGNREYQFQVRAVNAIGTSWWSSTVERRTS